MIFTYFVEQVTLLLLRARPKKTLGTSTKRGEVLNFMVSSEKPEMTTLELISRLCNSTNEVETASCFLEVRMNDI
jgi:hypothetical protein